MSTNAGVLNTLPPYEQITFDELNELFDYMPPTTPLAFYGRIGMGKSTVCSSHKHLQPVANVGLAMSQVEDLAGCIFPDKESQSTFLYPRNWFTRFCLKRQQLVQCHGQGQAHGITTPSVQCTGTPFYEFDGYDQRVAIGQDIPAGVRTGRLVCDICEYAIDLPVGTIFFDEADKGEREVQIAMMRILSERSLDDWILSPLIRVIIVSNRKIDQCAVYNEMPNEVKNRVIHLELVPTYKYWEANYATQNGVHPLVISYLKDHENELCKIDPGIAIYGFQSSRSWTKVSDTLKAIDVGMNEQLGFKITVGAIGRGGAEAFWTYRQFVDKCASIASLADGSGSFPDQSDAGLWIVLVARCVSAAESDLVSVKKDTRTLQQVVQVLIRMPDWARQYQMLLGTWLHRRPLTRDLFVNAQAMQTNKHLQILSEQLLSKNS